MQSQAATFALRATSVLDASIPVAQIPAAGAILELRDVPGTTTKPQEDATCQVSSLASPGHGLITLNTLL